jgi:hypothetical protein
VKIFSTRIDLADDRQVKQHENTQTTFSGSLNTLQYTTLGQDYGDLKKGADISTAAVTNYNPGLYLIFSFTGTTGSTTYFGITSPYTSIIPNLPVITPENQLGTNFISYYFDATQNVVVDGKSFDIVFSGSQFNFNVYDFAVIGVSGNTFTGYCSTNSIYTLSAKTYSWFYLKNGSTTWLDVNGRLDTQKLSVGSVDVPTGSTYNGITGTITWDNDYLYVCVSGNTWKRTQLTSF